MKTQFSLQCEFQSLPYRPKKFKKELTCDLALPIIVLIQSRGGAAR